jgi:membrane-bound lytic murein transglycosylase MltF
MLSNMPAEQAILVNPANQQQAIKGGTEYLLNRLMPQIQQCIDALDQLTPHLNAA